MEIFRRFDDDAGNLRQVLGACLAEREAETGLRMCTAMAPVWIVRGSFAEGAEWLDAFLGPGAAPVRAAVRGPALVGRAQLALASDSASAEALRPGGAGGLPGGGPGLLDGDRAQPAHRGRAARRARR